MPKGRNAINGPLGLLFMVVTLAIVYFVSSWYFVRKDFQGTDDG
jgi:hypothetical protein